ncbi:MAG: NADH-quinone oxidoreductase subunit C [Nanoarchaeota archaeon]
MISHMGKVYKKGKNFTFVEIKLSAFQKTMEKISEKTQRMTSIFGHDNGKTIEMFYHFMVDGHLWGAKFSIPRDNSTIPTVVGYFPVASLFERETHDLLGVNFEGNRNLAPLLLDKTLSPKTPLRKKAVK